MLGRRSYRPRNRGMLYSHYSLLSIPVTKDVMFLSSRGGGYDTLMQLPTIFQQNQNKPLYQFFSFSFLFLHSFHLFSLFFSVSPILDSKETLSDILHRFMIYFISKSAHVTLKIFDLKRLVQTLISLPF